jgi:hypothetical protein
MLVEEGGEVFLGHPQQAAEAMRAQLAAFHPAADGFDGDAQLFGDIIHAEQARLAERREGHERIHFSQAWAWLEGMSTCIPRPLGAPGILAAHGPGWPMKRVG